MIADSDGAVRPLITHKIHICTLSFALFAQFAAIIPGQAFNIQVRDPTPYGDVDLCAAAVIVTVLLVPLVTTWAAKKWGTAAEWEAKKAAKAGNT